MQPTNIGIYCLLHKPTGSLYVGSSKRLDQRWIFWKSALRRNYQKNPLIQTLHNKWGLDSFACVYLEFTTDADKLFELENKWIKRLNPDLNLYKTAKGTNWGERRNARRRKYLTGGKSVHNYRRYQLTAPDGTEYCTDHLAGFAELFSLERSQLTQVATGRFKSHLGWRCRYID